MEKERPRTRFAPDFGVNGLAAASRIALSAVKDSVYPSGALPHTAQIKIRALYIYKHPKAEKLRGTQVVVPMRRGDIPR
jgi:hypothetical protein